MPGTACGSTAPVKLSIARPPSRCRCHCRPRRRVVPPAACSASAPGSSTDASPKHFLRPSLVATGFAEPQDVVQHCLALFRKADLAGLQQYLPDSYPAASSTPTIATAAASSSSSSLTSSSGSSGRAPVLQVGPWVQVVEQGPLALLAGLLDVGARRVLPGHLLRRSQVLSTLRVGDAFQQRTALTACTGETSIFEWQLHWYPDAQQQQQQQHEDAAAPSSSSSGGGKSSGGNDSASNGGSLPTAADGGGGRWVIESVRRDASADLPLPTTPHPKAAPEAVVRAQLAALQQGDVFGASCYSMWHKRGMGSRHTSLGFHHDALRSKVEQQPYSLLLRHGAAQLRAAALPTQRDMLQEVAVMAADGASARFLFRLGMQAHGCWMVSGIFVEEESAAGWQG